jgi:NAD+ kinase
VTFGIAGNLEKKVLLKVARSLVSRLRHEGVDFVMERQLLRLLSKSSRSSARRMRSCSEKDLPRVADLIIALGGDGTILKMARVSGRYQTPILGVNLGKLGFLAEVSLDEIDMCVDELLEGKYLLEDRMMLEATSRGLGKSFVALNDIVVEKYGTSRVFDLETSVNEAYLATYAADGIIFSTPTGSTAYSLANGGPIVVPTSSVITINPICPHTLTARPVIVHSDSRIRVSVRHGKHKVHLTADGQLEKLFTSPVDVTIRRAPFSARLVKRLSTNYYDVLRKKLNWGSDLRLNTKV